MDHERQKAQDKADSLHRREEEEKLIAAALPEGPERDEHRMRGERLSDEAWSIEEENDLDPRPSGLWPIV